MKHINHLLKLQALLPKLNVAKKKPKKQVRMRSYRRYTFYEKQAMIRMRYGQTSEVSTPIQSIQNIAKAFGCSNDVVNYTIQKFARTNTIVDMRKYSLRTIIVPKEVSNFLNSKET